MLASELLYALQTTFMNLQDSQKVRECCAANFIPPPRTECTQCGQLPCARTTRVQQHRARYTVSWHEKNWDDTYLASIEQSRRRCIKASNGKQRATPAERTSMVRFPIARGCFECKLRRLLFVASPVWSFLCALR